MTILKSALVGVAATSLVASQALAAAPVAGSRVGAPVEGEALGLPPGSAPVIALLTLFALVAAVALISDDDEETPVSP